MLPRRTFLRTLAAASLAPALSRAAEPAAFSFILLGDLHFDRLEHHDMAWLEKNKAGDLGQIRNYSRITAELMPRLFATVRETVEALRREGQTPAFVLQVGDLVEGLCGSAELAARQNREAIAFLAEHETGLPFLFTKGNHDVTGAGANEAFAEVFHPFLTAQRRMLEPQAAPLDSARYTVRLGPAQFHFFDAYDQQSLAWLEAALAGHSAEHCFVIIHPPVIPYGARANWILFNSEKQRPQRAKLLDLLSAHGAIILGGHIHKFNSAIRQVHKDRYVTQLAVSSVINAAAVSPKNVLSGLVAYTPEQIGAEPNFSPETAPLRRAILEAERPFIRAFEYADLPGHAVVKVRSGKVTAEIYSGLGRELYKTIDLTAAPRA